MRQFIVLTLGLLSAFPLDVLAGSDSTSGKLVVHEWGTFTTFVGSDGGQLAFRAAIGADLPSFVLTRAEQADRFNPKKGFSDWELFTKNETVAQVRMETPVIYFYTDAPRDVQARVEFPKGMLTEFYPPVRLMTPAYDPKDGRNVLKGTALDWGKLHLVPQSMSANYPTVEGPSHYVHARATDAATVQFSDRAIETIEENFLFYRGLGNFNMNVTATAREKDQITLHNSSGGRISTAILIRSAGAGQTRFAIHKNLPSGQQETIALPSKESTASELSEAVVEALIAEGLYEKEARAMVKTWEDSWFGEEGTGTRVLYLLSRQSTDVLLPLQITPTPDETVRVMVGRIDVLTADQETRIAAMFRKAAAKEPLAASEAKEVSALGRFQSPAIDRVAQLQARELMNALNTAALTPAGE